MVGVCWIKLTCVNPTVKAILKCLIDWLGNIIMYITGVCLIKLTCVQSRQ